MGERCTRLHGERSTPLETAAQPMAQAFSSLHGNGYLSGRLRCAPFVRRSERALALNLSVSEQSTEIRVRIGYSIA